MKNTQEVMNIKEAAKFLRVCRTHFLTLIKRDNIPFYNMASAESKTVRARFLKADLLTYLQSLDIRKQRALAAKYGENTHGDQQV